MLIVLLLIAAFIVWHFIPRRDANQPAPQFRAETRAVASDPDWSRYIEEHCESPAETAFLRAMIKSFDLKPLEGALSGQGLRLDFQVEEGRYRVDFLANQWLVLEIDGDAYHSSAEAKARDKARDQHFESLGYTVLRIPAKVVFGTPEEAVRRARSALEVGKRSVPIQVKKGGWRRLSDTMTLIGEGASQISKSVSRNLALQRALNDAKLAFETEKTVIEAALESAQLKLKHDDWFVRQDETTRADFQQIMEDVRQAVGNSPDSQECVPNKIVYRPFPSAPSPDSNPEFHAAIQAGYAQIVEERDEFLEAQRAAMQADARLSPIVEKCIRELSAGEYWQQLSR